MTYQAPVRDHVFLLRDVLKIEKHANLPAFADASLDTVEQILDERRPVHRRGPGPAEHGRRQATAASGAPTTPSPRPRASRKPTSSCRQRLAPWASIRTYGGQGLPHVVNLAFSEMLELGQHGLLHVSGPDPRRLFGHPVRRLGRAEAAYLPKMVSGEWSGTMNLTEPHCGTDLGLLRTKAVPQADGSYKLTGQKIWISAGEHDMSGNIVHLVLARIEGAPAGTKGISLFIVPKFMVDADGAAGERNGVKCVGLEEKMGIHGNATCVMQYEEATGWLIGGENAGPALMFVMMNEARLGVGLQGMAQAEAAYQAAAAFAKDRLQGRSLTGPKNADGPADPIIVHPDVRRMLMDHPRLHRGRPRLPVLDRPARRPGPRHPDEKVRRRPSDYMA
jgi:hypothetical protein